MSETSPPILRRLVVDGTPELAFSAFADCISIWWPKAFSASGETLAKITVEPTPGGRIFETGANGPEIPWGSVVAIERGVRLVMEWWLGLPEGQRTTVEIVFLPTQTGTEIGFVHRGWSVDTAAQRAKFDHAEGWDSVLRPYREYAHWHAARTGPETTPIVVAGRRLWIVTETALTPVDIRFFAPQPAGGGWGCRYEIDWPERKRVFTLFGVDGVQALYLAMSMVGSELYGSQYHADGTLMFDGPGTGYGFPVSPGERDELIGHDRESF